MSFLEIDDLFINFGGLKALAGLSLSLERGEILAVIGPNGAGKSTLFNAINGFVDVHEGSIRLEGKELTRMSAHKRATLGITRTFQNLELLPFKTALDNVLMGLHLQIDTGLLSSAVWFGRNRRSEAIAEEEALGVMSSLGIRFCRDMLTGSLPFVTRRMVELGRALVSRPRLMLLDEPSSGMNEQETRELGKVIKGIRTDYGVAIILVEHDMSLVMGISDRVYVLNFGRKLSEGTPEQIKRDKQVQEAFLGKSYDAGS